MVKMFVQAQRVFGLSVFVASIHLSVILTVIAAGRLFLYGVHDFLGLVLTAILLLLTLVPLPLITNKWTQQFIRFACSQAGAYFPTKVVVEDEGSLQPGRPYVIGFEPHSALPVGIPIVFATDSPLLPRALQGNCHGMASSVCFKAPIVRQLWWWLGLRPVSKRLISRLLSTGKSVVLCPGGVQECLYMDHDNETVFLRKRHGFVRMAIQHGAPLVPVFAFGQSRSYSWYRPGPPLMPASWVHSLSRAAGAVPLVLWGPYGTPLPHRHPVTVVIGKPIEVPLQAEPTHELVQQYLDKFIGAMSELFEKHKSSYGCVGMKLHVL